MSLAFLEFPINPMQIPSIQQRVMLVEKYAQRYVSHAKDVETLSDYCQQAGRDLKDRSFGVEVKAEIRHLERLGRGGY